ncbi:MAG: PEP-CTERM sorting domain-containing protein [Candidatus Schekmanbacteria bacterium]|nr:PEP-CTERM sorting domain-containing protein [Candidatus Schekmanbacteria bacterium]
MKKFGYSLMVALLLATAAEAAPTVTFDPMAATIDIGAIIDVSIKGLGFDTAIDGGGLNLKFNPSVLQVNNVVFNTTVWEFDTGYDKLDNSSGNLNDLYFLSWKSASGEFPIATVNMTAVGKGKSLLELNLSEYNPFASMGEIVPVSMDTASVNVNDPNATVPEPATISLLLAGLGLVGYKKTKK